MERLHELLLSSKLSGNPGAKNPQIKFRWTGPEPVSTLDFTLKKNSDCKIIFHILAYADRNLLDSLKLKVNNQPIKLIHSFDFSPKKGVTFEGTIPKDVLKSDKKFTRLTFQIKNTISALELDPNAKKNRKIGLAFEWLKILPV